MSEYQILVGNSKELLKGIEDKSVQTVVTSPPYWGLRDYDSEEQIGLEQSPQEFVDALCDVFDEVWRVLKDDGTFWLNIGDSYASFRDSKVVPDTLRKDGGGTGVAKGAANRNPKILKEAGLKHKDLVGIPWRVAFELQRRGWYLRSDIIWAKPNPMPESVKDRPTKSHEYLFLLTKSTKYFYDYEAIREPLAESTIKRDLYTREVKEGNKSRVAGIYAVDHTRDSKSNPAGKNKRDVWFVQTKPFKDAHFAVYPFELIEPCILAGSKEGDTVLDPFSGSGTTGVVALRHGRNYIGLELNPEYAELSKRRIKSDAS